MQGMNVRRAVTVGAAVAVLALALHLTAGTLEPPAGPGPTMRSLDEIYKNIQPGLPSDWQAMPDKEQIELAGAIHMKVEGERQGVIPGSCVTKGREGTMVVVGLGHEVDVPVDSGTGLPAGRKVHKPLVVVKYLDKASPKLYKALATGEGLRHVELKYYRPDRAGVPEHYYTVLLDDALIVNIQEAFPNVERISFAYGRIRWTWQDGVIEAEDDWITPRI